MSARSYYRECRTAKEVSVSRIRRDMQRNMCILTRGVYLAAALVFVFGVCMGNLEFLAISGALALFGKSQQGGNMDE